MHKKDRTWLKALLNDRGWVIFAWVNPVSVTYASSTEATVTGELKLSEQAAHASDFLVGSNVSVADGPAHDASHSSQPGFWAQAQRSR